MDTIETSEHAETGEMMGLSPAFHEGRREALIAALGRAGLDLLLVVDPVSIAYLSGFFHIETERPLALGLRADGEPFAVLPRMELEHFLETCPWLNDVDVYFDYPAGDWAWVAERDRKSTRLNSSHYS